MYYSHFGLKEPPFKITPNTDFFFSGSNRGAVLDALVYAITSGVGIVKVVGEVGSGKTMLCRMLQTVLPEKIEIVYLDNPSVAPEDALHAIAFELQLKLPKNADRLKVMQELQAHLLRRHAEGKQVVIFVEEAQGMPLATLEEIRLLSNLETKQDKLLQIVLFGQPELDTNLDQTHIRQLRERITHSFYLGPLQTKDIGEYLIFRLRAAGYYGPHLFSNAAIKKISKAAKGLVRRVNILADKSLLAAFADNVYQVTPKHVKDAIRDSEFAPQPFNYRKYLPFVVVVIVLLMMALTYAWWHSQKTNNKAVFVRPQSVKDSIVVVADGVKKPEITPLPPPVVSNYPKQLLVDDRLETTKLWLSSESPNTITLQLKLLSGKEQTQEERLRWELDKLAQTLEIDNVYVYRKKHHGELRTVILYGAFTQRSDALTALSELPDIVKNGRPHLRTVAGINKDITQQ